MGQRRRANCYAIYQPGGDVRGSGVVHRWSLSRRRRRGPDSLEASWSEAELFALMGRHPKIAINVIRVIGKRLQEVQDRVREISTQRAERRIAHAVLRLAGQAGHSTIEGTAIAFPLRRKDVAALAGTTLHTASRILTAWEKAGLLISQHQRLTVCRPSEIRRIAEDGVR